MKKIIVLVLFTSISVVAIPPEKLSPCEMLIKVAHQRVEVADRKAKIHEKEHWSDEKKQKKELKMSKRLARLVIRFNKLKTEKCTDSKKIDEADKILFGE